MFETEKLFHDLSVLSKIKKVMEWTWDGLMAVDSFMNKFRGYYAKDIVELI